VHAVADVQALLVRNVSSAPLGVAGDSSVHVVPLKPSASGCQTSAVLM
jgi:hypothetical protein